MNPIRHRSVSITLTAAALLMIGAATAGAVADEPPTLESAVASFGERMIAAGWESAGPSDIFEDADADADATDPYGVDVFEGLDDPTDGLEDAFIECVGDGASVLLDAFGPGGDRAVPTAQSDELVFGSEPTGSTDQFGFDIEYEETVALGLVSVPDDETELAHALVDVFGSASFAGCFIEMIQMPFAELLDDDDELLGPLFGDMFEELLAGLDAQSESDLGVGDNSGRLVMTQEDALGMSVSSEATIDIVVAGNRVIMMYYLRIGPADGLGEAPPSGFDAVAELQHIVDDLDA